MKDTITSVINIESFVNEASKKIIYTIHSTENQATHHGNHKNLERGRSNILRREELLVHKPKTAGIGQQF